MQFVYHCGIENKFTYTFRWTQILLIQCKILNKDVEVPGSNRCWCNFIHIPARKHDDNFVLKTKDEALRLHRLLQITFRLWCIHLYGEKLHAMFRAFNNVSKKRLEHGNSAVYFPCHQYLTGVTDSFKNTVYLNEYKCRGKGKIVATVFDDYSLPPKRAAHVRAEYSGGLLSNNLEKYNYCTAHNRA